MKEMSAQRKKEMNDTDAAMNQNMIPSQMFPPENQRTQSKLFRSLQSVKKNDHRLSRVVVADVKRLDERGWLDRKHQVLVKKVSIPLSPTLSSDDPLASCFE